MHKNNSFCGYEDFTKVSPFDFSKHSSIGVGGVAKAAFYPKNESELKMLLSRLKNDGIGYIVVGNMTNVLPPDNGTEKAVICTKNLVESGIGEKSFVSAGVTSGCLLKACRYAKKSGAEFLVGVPCTLGGALYMNAGVSGKYIAEIVESVRVYRSGQILDLPIAECGYSYKNSVFMQNEDIILGATLCLTDSDEKNIREAEKAYLQRRAHLPKGKSMGCVFKNPSGSANGASAGEWIERAGLKGLHFGGAYVSKEHANFIINDGNATAQDILRLIDLIKKTVYTQYRVTLEEEIRYLE